MTQNELAQILKRKYGQVKLAPLQGVRIPCPTCEPSKAKQFKRYVYPQYRTTGCYICNRVLSKDDVCGAVLKYDGPIQIIEDKEHPQSRQIPFVKAIPINQLPGEHPAVKFLAKDYLYDYNKYYNKYGIQYIPLESASDIVFDSGEKITRISTAESLFFPVGFNHEYVGWQIRYIPNTFNGGKMISRKIKYMHVFPKGKYLFNYDNAKKHENVVVVEGIKKALKIDNAVATLGKGISTHQFQLLLQWKRITILLDGDAPTQTVAQNLRFQFQASGKDCRNIDLRQYGIPSPDEMTTEQIQFAVNHVWTTPLK